jgi:hypothetical protein
MSVSMQRFPRLKALPCVDLDLARAIPHTGSTTYFFLPHLIANTISPQDPCRWSIGVMELWPASSWGYNKIQLSKISVVSYRCGPLPASRATPQSTFVLFFPLPPYYLIVALGFFVDGVLLDLMSWAYPRPVMAAQTGTYVIGDDSEESSMSWCVASATLLSLPLGMIRTSMVFPCWSKTPSRRPYSSVYPSSRAQI